MILLREIQEKDVDTLERFAQIPGFINLPNDRDLLKEKISRAIQSFRGLLTNKMEGKYIFAAEDVETGRMLGTSMIATQHGTVESPHFYFEIGSEEKISATINTGFIHGTLKLKYDTNGPSEIGGLVIDPEIRNSPAHIGRQISFSRFLFLGLNKNLFKRKIIAELLPPLNKKGQSPLWEAVGRRFTNMDYWEADQLCQQNKEFIFSLFPTGKIYTTFLSAEARNSIGKVGKETEPVLHMLKKIGFTYRNQVDPFDGGPHLWASVDDILPVRRIRTLVFQPDILKTRDSALNATQPEAGLICLPQIGFKNFRAIGVHAVMHDQALGVTDVSTEDLETHLGLKPGDPVVFMPYY